MKAAVFKQQIMAVVNLWETMLIFTPSVIHDWTTRLDTGVAAESTEGMAIDETDGAPLPSDDPAPMNASGFKPVARPQGQIRRHFAGKSAPVDVEADDGDLC